MTLPSVMLAVSAHSAASDSSGIRSRLISVSRADLVRGGGGLAAMAPLRTQLIQDSIGRLRRNVVLAVNQGAASAIKPEGPGPAAAGLDAQRTPTDALHANRHSQYPPCVPSFRR